MSTWRRSRSHGAQVDGRSAADGADDGEVGGADHGEVDGAHHGEVGGAAHEASH